MPELPDVDLYIEHLERRLGGATLERVRLLNPFVLRTAVPPIGDAQSRRVLGFRRLGKRIVIALEGELFLVIHLMIAGRLRWSERGAKPAGRNAIAALELDRGTLVLTEAGTKRRASIHLVSGEPALRAMDPGGLEVFEMSAGQFAAQLRKESHTLKRALTDPHLFSGIGNAYSDEILHRAKLSPVTLTSRLTDEEALRLYHATREELERWRKLLRDQAGEAFPDKVSAFRPEMAVHGRFGQPCPVCGAPVQRIVYAENEANYCARCQTGGKLLADRALSRLLKKSWPKSIDELE